MKRGMKREIVTLGGQKKQETAMRKKLKRKMNQQRGQPGFPASRKAKSLRPLQVSPISVVFIDNTKGGKLAKIFKEEETWEHDRLQYQGGRDGRNGTVHWTIIQ